MRQRREKRILRPVGGLGRDAGGVFGSMQSRALDREGRPIGDESKEVEVVVGEPPRLRRADVDNAQEPVSQFERHAGE